MSRTAILAVCLCALGNPSARAANLFEDDFSNGTGGWDGAFIVTGEGLPAPCATISYQGRAITKQAFDYAGKGLEVSMDMKAPGWNGSDQDYALFYLTSPLITPRNDWTIAQLYVKRYDNKFGCGIMYEIDKWECVEFALPNGASGDGWHVNNRMKIRPDGHVEFYYGPTLMYTSTNTLITMDVGGLPGQTKVALAGWGGYWDNVVVTMDDPPSPTIVIDDCDTGVINQPLPGGTTMADEITTAGEIARNHGAFVKAVAQLTNDWRKQGLISGADKGRIQSCAAKAALPPTADATSPQ